MYIRSITRDLLEKNHLLFQSLNISQFITLTILLI